MSTNPFTVGIVALLTIALMVPATFFMAPQRVEAQALPGVPINSVGPLDFIDTIKATLSEIHQFTSMVADIANYVNTYVLQPLAFVLSGQLMKALTAKVMQFVIGKANGTGIPQFAVDVQKSLRSISDFQAQAYFRQVSLTNSPFASSVAQALGINYNQSTSLAGYWAANMNTLGRNIPNYNSSFLAGNWSQGGVAAWFQLTTQTQNNPYTLFQNSQAQLANVIGPGVGGGSGARLAQLGWGQGFMSWCSANKDEATNAVYTRFAACVAQCKADDVSCQEDCQQGASTAGNAGINPGDPCTSSDGTPGTIQTPGSTIKATLDKVLGGQQDKLVQMGNISSQINSILGNIGTVLNTINLAANILGGDNGNGLLNAGSPGGALTTFTSSSAPAQSVSTSSLNYFGTGGSGIVNSANSSAVTSASNIDTNAAVAQVTSAGLSTNSTGGTGSTSDMPTRVQKYESAWSAIASVANETKTALQTEMSVCHAYWNGTSAYENEAQNALSFEVNPILAQAAGIQAIGDAALAHYNLVQSESTSSSTYDADLQKLNTMTPTAGDVATAEYNATAYGGSVANPIGSLTVSGSSIVDQMNLIRNNALSIQANSCTSNAISGGE
jgi:hypothetical protein